MAVLAAFSAAFLAAIVGLMQSTLPVFWPLTILTLSLALTATLGLLNWDWVQARSQRVRRLMAVGTVIVIVGMMVKPLLAQWERETQPPTPTEKPVEGAPPTPTDPLEAGIGFRISPGHGQTIVHGEVVGRARLEANLLRIAVDTLVLTTHKGAPVYVVKSVRLGIANWNPDYQVVGGGNWSVAHWADTMNLDLTIESNTSKTLPGFERLFPVQHLGNRQRSWLVLEINVVGQPSAYIHSDPQVFCAEC